MSSARPHRLASLSLSLFALPLALCAGLSLAAAPLFAQEGYDPAEPQADPSLGLPWPFGPGSRFSARGDLDLYNLGLLGAKAKDKNKPLPKRSTGRTTGTGGGSDAYPSELELLILHPDGAAKAAGLKAGDVIIGAGKRPFRGDAGPELAKLLQKAEASKKRTLTLIVLRGGEGRPEKVTVTLLSGDKVVARPTRQEARRLMADPALAWLAKRQAEDGGYAATLSGLNGAIVQTSLAGLAWLAGGSTSSAGPHADSVRRAADYVMTNLDAMEDGFGERGGGGGNWNQTNWAWAHAAIFLGELQLRDPRPLVERELVRIAAEIVKRQEKSGGYAHGPGGPNALNYLELNIVTGLMLSGLGLAQACGAPVDQNAVKKAIAYLEASSSGGGVGYSDRSGQRGQGNVGRTAAAWLGAQRLGVRGKLPGAMRSWLGRRDATDPFGGHASLMQHILLAGVASQALGGKTEKAFWKRMEAELFLARAPDGSFQPRPWQETQSLKSNSDVSFGEVWTTSVWAVILLSGSQAPEGEGLPGWQGRS